MILELIRIIFLITFNLFSLFAFFFFISVFLGAPYVPTPMSKVKLILKLVKIGRNDSILDLGSGDGRMVVEAARMGAKATGIEINPGLLVYSIIKAKFQKVSNKTSFSWGSIYKRDLTPYNKIFVAGYINMVAILEKEFENKLKKGTEVILYAFPFPNKKPRQSIEGIYIYKY